MMGRLQLSIFIFVLLVGCVEAFFQHHAINFLQNPRAGSLLKRSCANQDRRFSQQSICMQQQASFDKDKIFVVTGSTDGIGRHTCRRLAETGARVAVHGRNEMRCKETVNWLKTETGNEKIDYFVADISEMQNVQNLADQILKKYPHIDCLINNAGVYEPEYQLTRDDMEMTFAVNVAAPYVLTQRLLPLLTKKHNSESRLIVVASLSADWSIDLDNLQYQNGGFSGHNAYSLSKLCDQMLAFELDARFGTPGKLTVNTLDPGTVDTKMLRAGWSMGGIPVSSANYEFYLATSPDVEGISGKYFVGNSQYSAPKVAYDVRKRQRLWQYLEDITGVAYYR